jgi:hypothetical protein
MIGCWNTVRKTYFLRHLYIKTITLPRQARDKHRDNSKNGRFSQGVFSWDDPHDRQVMREKQAAAFAVPLFLTACIPIVYQDRLGMDKWKKEL